MEEKDQQIQETVKKALKEKSSKDALLVRILMAFLFGGISGYVVFKYNGFFSIINNDLFWAIGLGAIAGFFIVEFYVIVVLGITGVIIYSLLQDSWVSGSNYSVEVENQSLKILSIKIISPMKCGTWKSEDNRDLITTINPGEVKKVFNGCKASAFNVSINGLVGAAAKPVHSNCLELISSLKLTYNEDGWSDRSFHEAIGTNNQPGAIRECKKP